MHFHTDFKISFFRVNNRKKQSLFYLDCDYIKPIDKMEKSDIGMSELPTVSDPYSFTGDAPLKKDITNNTP